MLSILVPFFYWTALIVSIAIGASLKVDMIWLAREFPELNTPILYLRGVAFAVLPLATLAVALLSHIKMRLRFSDRERVVKSLLNSFLAEGFDGADATTTHRVTLFKHTRWLIFPFCIFERKNPYAGWLLPYERAGEFSLGTGVKFYAPKDNPDKFEGVVGFAFGTGNCEYIPNLPDLAQSSSRAQIKKYAKATNMPEGYVKQRLKKNKRMPRSFWGMPIEVDGKRWGVLLVDSFDAEIPNNQSLKQIFRQQAHCYNAILSIGKK